MLAEALRIIAIVVLAILAIIGAWCITGAIHISRERAKIQKENAVDIPDDRYAEIIGKLSAHKDNIVTNNKHIQNLYIRLDDIDKKYDGLMEKYDQIIDKTDGYTGSIDLLCTHDVKIIKRLDELEKKVQS